jgi:hypothetical protein
LVPVVEAEPSEGPCSRGTPSNPSCGPLALEVEVGLEPEDAGAVLDAAGELEAEDEVDELLPQATRAHAAMTATRAGRRR